MKKYIRNTLLTVLSLLSLCTTVLSQDRTVKVKPIIGTKTISQLKKATGWMLNKDAEWVSLKNTIPTSTLGSKYKSLYGYEKYGIGCDNFNFFKLKEITHNDIAYFILIKQYRSGYYKYSNIEEDWRPNISHSAYVFSKSELTKLNSINDSQINMVEIQLIDYLDLRYTSESEAIEEIKTKINLDKAIDKTLKLILHIAPYKEKKIVQFQIYSIEHSFKYINGINRKNASRVKEYYLKDELFKHSYYETDYSNFNKFLNIQTN